MHNEYYNNLVSVDIDTLDRYVPGLSGMVSNNCKDKNAQCCINACNIICKNGGCDRNWQDICNDNCDDLVK